MFAGIVEANASLKNVERRAEVTKITVEKPFDWKDLKGGDSIAVNGICLTVEGIRPDAIEFALGPETLRVTGWLPTAGQSVNLERSLRMGDRIHGHFVSGHVDTVGKVVDIVDSGATRELEIEYPREFAPFVWRKGSVAVHGVSLTVNQADESRFRVGLIPETMKRTNLGSLEKGDSVHLEADAMARAWFHWREQR